MQRGRENNECSFYLFFLPNSPFLFLFLFFFFFFWEGFECLLLQTITLIYVTSFEVIFTPFQKRALSSTASLFKSAFRLHREGIEYYST